MRIHAQQRFGEQAPGLRLRLCVLGSRMKKAGPASKGAWRCLKAIKSYDFQKRGWSCPSLKTLAADLDRTPRQIKRYIAELVSGGDIFTKRRPNTSNAYYFGASASKNVPTVGTNNVPADVPADVPAINIILKAHSNAQPKVPTTSETLTLEGDSNSHPPIRLKESKSVQPPAFLRTPAEIKLWKLALEYLKENRQFHSERPWHARVAIAMHALEESGAMLLPEVREASEELLRKPVKKQNRDRIEILRRSLGE